MANMIVDLIYVDFPAKKFEPAGGKASRRFAVLVMFRLVVSFLVGGGRRIVCVFFFGGDGAAGLGGIEGVPAFAGRNNVLSAIVSFRCLMLLCYFL